MTRRENLIAYIRRKAFESVPVGSECFMDTNAADSYFRNKSPEQNCRIEKDLLTAEVLNSSSILVEPRVFTWKEEKVGEYETFRTYKTGAVWRYVTRLFPDVRDEDDSVEVKKTIDALHDEGYYVEIVLYGVWLGIYLTFMQFEDGGTEYVSTAGSPNL